MRLQRHIAETSGLKGMWPQYLTAFVFRALGGAAAFIGEGDAAAEGAAPFPQR